MYYLEQYISLKTQMYLSVEYLGVYRGLIYEEHYISSKLGMGMN